MLIFILIITIIKYAHCFAYAYATENNWYNEEILYNSFKGIYMDSSLYKMVILLSMMSSIAVAMDKKGKTPHNVQNMQKSLCARKLVAQKLSAGTTEPKNLKSKKPSYVLSRPPKKITPKKSEPLPSLVVAMEKEEVFSHNAPKSLAVEIELLLGGDEVFRNSMHGVLRLEDSYALSRPPKNRLSFLERNRCPGI